MTPDPFSHRPTVKISQRRKFHQTAQRSLAAATAKTFVMLGLTLSALTGVLSGTAVAEAEVLSSSIPSLQQCKEVRQSCVNSIHHNELAQLIAQYDRLKAREDILEPLVQECLKDLPEEEGEGRGGQEALPEVVSADITPIGGRIPDKVKSRLPLSKEQEERCGKLYNELVELQQQTEGLNGIFSLLEVLGTLDQSHTELSQEIEELECAAVDAGPGECPPKASDGSTKEELERDREALETTIQIVEEELFNLLPDDLSFDSFMEVVNDVNSCEESFQECRAHFTDL